MEVILQAYLTSFSHRESLKQSLYKSSITPKQVNDEWETSNSTIIWIGDKTKYTGKQNVEVLKVQEDNINKIDGKVGIISLYTLC